MPGRRRSRPIVLGAMTATFGGIIRDVIIGQVTLIVSGEIYVTAAVLGATVYVVVRAISGDALLAACLGAAAAFGLRSLALGLGWSLPRFPPSPPDTPPADRPEPAPPPRPFPGA